MEKRANVLFLCTGNSARSVMAEACLTRLAPDRFTAFSAGSHPTGAINRFALDLLRKLDHPVDTLRSKDMQEFLERGAPAMDFVFTVCDNAARSCPMWPRRETLVIHWPFEDPAALDGDDAAKQTLFETIYRKILRRLESFVSLPFDALDRDQLQRRLAHLPEDADIVGERQGLREPQDRA